MSDVTRILQLLEEGQPQASEDLFPLVYQELRNLAAARMMAERPDHTLSATALVNEAYLRLVDTEKARNWDSRGHFFTAAAEAMRRILVDHARRKLSLKRGGKQTRQPLGEDLEALPYDPELLVDLHDAIERLEGAHPQAGQMLKLVLFAGMSIPEAGRMLNLPRKTAYRRWDFVRSWFRLYADTPDD